MASYGSSVDMDPQVIAADVSTYLYRIWTYHWVQVLTTTIIIYDIFTTFDREYHYVWKARWSYAKGIFFLNRYLAPIMFLVEMIATFSKPPSLNFCIKTGWFFGMTCAAVMTIVSSVLTTRVWAVYERDRRVLAFFVTFFIVVFTPAWAVSFRGFAAAMRQSDVDTIVHIYAYLGMAQASGGPAAVEKAWPLTRCFLSHFPKTYPAVILASLVYESTVFSAMAYKMVQEKKKTRLIEAFYRDGVMYYIVMFCCLLSAAICALSYDNETAQAIMASAYFIGIKSMMCSHVILRLRSYFSYGDAIVDGRQQPTFDHNRAGKVGNIESTGGVVSTIINFAQMEALGGPGGETDTFPPMEGPWHRRRRPRDHEASIPLEEVDTLDHQEGDSNLQRWGTEEEKCRTSTSGGQSSLVPSTSESEPSVDWTDLPAPRPRRANRGEGRSGRKDVEHCGDLTAGRRSTEAQPHASIAAGQCVSENPVGETYPPSGRISLQGSSVTRLEAEESTLGESKQPTTTSLNRRSDERGEEGVHGGKPPSAASGSNS